MPAPQGERLLPVRTEPMDKISGGDGSRCKRGGQLHVYFEVEVRSELLRALGFLGVCRRSRLECDVQPCTGLAVNASLGLVSSSTLWRVGTEMDPDHGIVLGF